MNEEPTMTKKTDLRSLMEAARRGDRAAMRRIMEAVIGQRETSAARAFGVSPEDLEAVKNMPGATWAEGEYPEDPFKSLKED